MICFLVSISQFCDFDLVASSSTQFPLPCLFGLPSELDSLALSNLSSIAKGKPQVYLITKAVCSPATKLCPSHTTFVFESPLVSKESYRSVNIDFAKFQ